MSQPYHYENGGQELEKTQSLMIGTWKSKLRDGDKVLPASLYDVQLNKTIDSSFESPLEGQAFAITVADLDRGDYFNVT